MPRSQGLLLRRILTLGRITLGKHLVDLLLSLPLLGDDLIDGSQGLGARRMQLGYARLNSFTEQPEHCFHPGGVFSHIIIRLREELFGPFQATLYEVSN